MTFQNNKSTSGMPAPGPMPMPIQNLQRPFSDCNAPILHPMQGTSIFRWATFIPALFTTLILLAIFSDWFQRDGFAPLEIAMIFLTGFSAFWIALSVASATIGLFFARNQKPAPRSRPIEALNVALLVPVYNEDPQAVFQRIEAMRQELSRRPTNHRFAFFVLSDTRNDDIAKLELAEFARMQREPNAPVPVFYRRRAENIERKTGNIRDWILNWGSDWTAFITLDADSLMSAQTILRLSDEMAAAPDAGLIQTVPHLLGANTLFSRVQQFANNVHGTVLACGLERWSGNEGNYWGHNAIIRTKAFANCAGLPRLSGTGALGGTIKSHDFVEAALLRRAGWAVRLLPTLDGSFEETPQTLVDYVLRDRRWCQGNLQHLRLLATRGLHAASRFHMLQGAMAYVASVVWFALLVLWTLMGRSEEHNVIRYFTDSNPLFPQWPEMDFISRTVVLAFMFALLLAPKLFSIAGHLLEDPNCIRFGGRGRFFSSVLLEIFLSIVLAPIMMVQHVLAVGRTVIRLDAGWAPQNRAGTSYSWQALLRFHWLETVMGILLMSGMLSGLVTLWLLPIAVSLVAAVPISRWMSAPLPLGSAISKWMSTPEEITPQPIIERSNSNSPVPVPA